MGPAPFTTMGPAFYRAHAGAERHFLHLKYLNEGIARRWAEHGEHKAEQHSRIPTPWLHQEPRGGGTRAEQGSSWHSLSPSAQPLLGSP